jgi:hypothetical protein
LYVSNIYDVDKRIKKIKKEKIEKGGKRKIKKPIELYSHREEIYLSS